MIVDVHNHYYAPEYIDALRKGGTIVTVEEDADGNPVLVSPGDRNYAVPGHRDIDFRQDDVAAQGVDTQVLSLTTPGTYVAEGDAAVTLSRMVNDIFARIVRERAPRFSAYATLPLTAPEAAPAELRRAMEDLGLPGAMVFSNVNGVALADARYEPLWAEADRLGAVIHIHPNYPVGVEAMADYWLMPLVGFLFDTTLATAHLVFAGVPERYPSIRWVLGHLGGAIPYLAERLDRGWRNFPECRAAIPRTPSDYLRTHFWYDTVNFDPKALRLAVDFAGADHILAGSDYPHTIGSIPLMREALAALDVSDAERDGILGRNASALLGLR